MENNEIRVVENTAVTDNTTTDSTHSENVVSEVKEKTSGIHAIKKFLPVILAAVIGVCLFVAFRGPTTKYWVYDFDLYAYGETLNGNTSELIEDCKFKINYKNNKITMEKAGEKFKGTIKLREYNKNLESFVYAISWEKTPKLIAGYKTSNIGMLLKQDTTVDVTFFIDESAKGTDVEIQAWYYCEKE